MLMPQIMEIRLIALELATVPEARDRAEKILLLIEEAAREEAKINAIVERHIAEVSGIFGESNSSY